MKTDFMITTYAENSIGMLYRILNVFSRRMINVESLTVVGADKDGQSKITFVIQSTDKIVRNIIKQIDKLIGVHDTLFNSNTVHTNHKISLYRLFTKTLDVHGETIPILSESLLNAKN